MLAGLPHRFLAGLFRRDHEAGVACLLPEMKYAVIIMLISRSAWLNSVRHRKARIVYLHGVR